MNMMNIIYNIIIYSKDTILFLGMIFIAYVIFASLTYVPNI